MCGDKQNFSNVFPSTLNAAHHGRTFPSQWKLKPFLEKETFQHTFSCAEKEDEYHARMMAPTDMYTNDTISAVHVLRLMDQGACSSATRDVPMGSKQDESVKQPHFPNNRYHNFLGLDDEIFRATASSSMQETPFDYVCQNHQQGNPSKLYGPNLKAGMFGSPFQENEQNQGGNERSFGFMGRFTGERVSSYLKSHGKGKTKGTSLVQHTRGRPRSYGSALQDGNFSKCHETVPVYNLKRRVLSSTYSTKAKDSLVTQLVVPDARELNKNPYVIMGEDQRPLKLISLNDGSRLTTEGCKRRRTMKLTAIQGY